MTELVEKRKVTNGLIAFIKSEPVVLAEGIRVGDTDAPSPNSGEGVISPPFIEVLRLPDGRRPQGGWGQPHNVEFAKYQLRLVGTGRENAEGLADGLRAWFIEQAPTAPHDYLRTITIADHSCIGREVQNDLGYVPSGRSQGVLQHWRIQVQRNVP